MSNLRTCIDVHLNYRNNLTISEMSPTFKPCKKQLHLTLSTSLIIIFKFSVGDDGLGKRVFLSTPSHIVLLFLSSVNKRFTLQNTQSLL